MYEKEIQLVENLLESYPSNWSENYYNNKKTLKINKVSENLICSRVTGSYDEINNIITIYDDESIIHELFHVCFRDEKKLNQVVLNNYCYSNGIALKSGENKYGKALTEGFVEYLNRKIKVSKHYNFEYFIVDLLISIYGEDILKYPLTNDIVGFYNDKRFFDIASLAYYLDLCLIYTSDIQIFVDCSSVIIKKETNEEKKKQQIKSNLKHIDKSLLELYKNIIKCLNIIIKGYNECVHPKIDQYQFHLKVDEFMKNQVPIINLLEYKNYDINKKIEKSLKKIRRK